MVALSEIDQFFGGLEFNEKDPEDPQMMNNKYKLEEKLPTSKLNYNVNENVYFFERVRQIKRILQCYS